VFWFAHVSHAPASFVDANFKQFGQYHGAGVFTGFGLRLRHWAQRKRLPFTAVFGRNRFPVLGKFFFIETSAHILAHGMVFDNQLRTCVKWW
jgi:hypothetical protein